MKVPTAITASLMLGIIGSVWAAEEPPASPIQVRFEEPNPGKHKASVPVSLALVVERNPKGALLDEGDAQLELLLRLPAGVKLIGAEGWRPEPLPKEEEGDSSGPWRLYKRQQPVKVPPLTRGHSSPIAQVSVELTVMEEGVNWVITTRAKLTQGQQGWQTFGVIFATLQNGIVEFHSTPRQGGDSPLRGQSP